MKPPIYVRALTESERKQLEKGLRSGDSFTLRRCQILLASAAGRQAKEIAGLVGCSDQTVRDVIRAFEKRGLECLGARSHATHTKQALLDEGGVAQLKEMLHQSPRCLGRPPASGHWTWLLR